jgi:hypothetical protein
MSKCLTLSCVPEKIGTIATLSVPLGAFTMFCAGLQPLSPFITAVLLVGISLYMIAARGVTAALCMTGVLLYAVSFPVTANVGVMYGMTVWALGVALWCAALSRTIAR